MVSLPLFKAAGRAGRDASCGDVTGTACTGAAAAVSAVRRGAAQRNSNEMEVVTLHEWDGGKGEVRD
jgi:hypothetical protein